MSVLRLSTWPRWRVAVIAMVWVGLNMAWLGWQSWYEYQTARRMEDSGMVAITFDFLSFFLYGIAPAAVLVGAWSISRLGTEHGAQ